MHLKVTLIGPAFLFLSLAAPTADAIDVLPYDSLAAPAGTFAWTQYFAYSKSHDAFLHGKSVGGSLKAMSVSQRLTYFFDIFGQPALVTGVVPFVDLRDGNIAGAPLNESKGIGDTSVAFTYWLHSDNERKRVFNLSAYLFIPTGKYHPSDTMNPGTNRTSYAFQIAGAYGFGKKWLLEGIADATFHGDNTNADGFGSALKQDPTYSAQAWVSYAVTPKISFSAGWAGGWGGKQKVNGLINGFSSKRQQARGVVSWNVTPSLQILGQISRDFKVKGGFQADTSYVLRISKTF
ncbi:outer membrane putative beta-barrel porin/alpha-amylase [Advenella incenata]|uniref:Outer membrane putative beta-barrel porin/alpha-amylase n=1 Tax=Advenella incenata TaxID=267800 RepID=A0A4Q7VFT0_9BURK|nr:transporter [Advenella incenata]RZT94848.1 outer membrane putative beta-barrel porin/alpha-amylase [Advenella incenata]